jgi:hypothetical protein
MVRKRRELSVMRMLAVVALLYAVAGCVGTSSRVSGVSLCDIVKRPENYDGKTVNFRSLIESDGLHGSFLADSQCKPFIGLDDEGAADMGEVNRVLDTVGSPGTMRKSVSATWTGVIRLRGAHVFLVAAKVEDVSYRLSSVWRRSGDPP